MAPLENRIGEYIVSLVIVGTILAIVYARGTFEGAAISVLIAWIAGVGIVVSGAVYVVRRAVEPSSQ